MEVEVDDGATVGGNEVDGGTRVVVVEEVVVVDVPGSDGDVSCGPIDPSLTTGANPRSADNMLGSFPSMPSAQMPTPAKLFAAASWVASYKDVGSSKNVSCHCVPTS